MKTIDKLTSFSTPEGRFSFVKEFECEDIDATFKLFQLVGEHKYIVKRVGSPLGDYQTFESVDFMNELYGMKIV